MATIVRIFWGKRGVLSLPGQSIPFWGLASLPNLPPQAPARTITAEVGDTVQIVLFNNFLNNDPIGERLSLMFPGQEGVSALSWPAGSFNPVQPKYIDGNLVSLADYVETGSFGELKALMYQFKVDKPGIYLYESGTNSQKQIQMGIYGVILVYPNGYNNPSHPNYKTAYGFGTSSNYDLVKTIALGEWDSVMHQNVQPNINYDMLEFNPDYWVANGRSYPDTVTNINVHSQPYNSLITCRVGDHVLLRLINSGFQNHTFYFGGMIGRIIGEDGYPLVHSGLDQTYGKTGITLAPGKSADVILVPLQEGEYYLYEREFDHLVNHDSFPGGMMTKIMVTS